MQKLEYEIEINEATAPVESFDWKATNLEDWETPETELEAEPEFQHLKELCKELDLEL